MRADLLVLVPRLCLWTIASRWPRPSLCRVWAGAALGRSVSIRTWTGAETFLERTWVRKGRGALRCGVSGGDEEV